MQWLALSMARDGLLTNGDWVMPAADRAAKLFSDPRLDLPAQFLAAMHRYALDYIEQAPVLVAVAAAGKDMLKRSDRLEVLRAFKAACAQGMRLPALLQSYGIAPQLRALDGKALRSDQADLLKALSKIHPSTLAQAIPKSVERQIAWLDSLGRWRATMHRRCRESDLFLEWTAARIRSEQDRNAAAEVADFASQNRTAFDVRWSMEQAINASQRWHIELARRPFAAEALRPDWKTVIDYGGLPRRMEVDGYEFRALQTREALFEEGAAMQHCVRTYADRVAYGSSRIYSVLQGGKRVATLELIPSSWGTGQYEFSQCKSVRNSRPESKATVAASEFIKRVNAAIPTKPVAVQAAPDQRQITPQERQAVAGRGAATRAELCGRLGQEVYASWFAAFELEGFDGTVLFVSFPTRFLRNWVATHYADALLACCVAEFPGVRRIEVMVRQPGTVRPRPAMAPPPVPPERGAGDGGAALARAPARAPLGRTNMGDFEGSPLDPNHTFESFATGSGNRMAHAAAAHIAEAVQRRQANAANPVFIHAGPGLGKTHLLHAIAWQVQREAPEAQVLHLTAERFRYQFVAAMQSSDPAEFEYRLGRLDLMLVDDLEFMCGAATEPAFERIVGALLDRGGRLVVAAAQAPAHLERLSARMRSRLSRGLVTEIGPLDTELRLAVLEQQLAQKCQQDPTFAIDREIVVRIARSAEGGGREIAGIVTRLHAMWSFLRQPITAEVADQAVRDLAAGSQQRGPTIADIQSVVAQHFGVSRADLLSERRHRSIVWPRQVGIYLARRLAPRGLPEIGRRFGGRDHTVVLHAIRKVEQEMANNPAVRAEIDALLRLLGGAPAAELATRRAA